MSTGKASSELKTAFRRHPLDAIFKPRNVAVIGATEKEDSVGRTLLWNLIKNPFGGTVFPVNPKRTNVLGIRAYPSIRDVPDQVDLAVVVTPAPTVPGIIAECVEAGVKGAIIISAGFKETGEEGAKLEQQILEIARNAQMRIIGPNCLGVMSPLTGINATFAKGMALPGSVGFISQSGALCTSVLDWSLEENVGFSAFVSIGSMLDVDWADLIYYLGDDPRTKAIVLNSPNNPTGRVFTHPELEAIAELAAEFDTLVLTDEIYEHILYDGAAHQPIAGLPGMRERTVLVNSMSKTWSVTGWRVGWVLAPAAISDAIRKVHDFLTVGAPAPLQQAGAVALSLPESYYRDLAATYQARRGLLLGGLARAGFPYHPPQGAYYVLCDISAMGFDDDVAFVRRLIRDIGVAGVPGSSFFADPARGSRFVRFCFCKKEETIAEACRRLERAQAKL